jgi:hypothetical protein
MRLFPGPIGIGMGACGGDCYRELPRILLPRTWVNRGKEEGRSSYAPALAPFSASNRYSASCTMKLP